MINPSDYSLNPIHHIHKTAERIPSFPQFLELVPWVIDLYFGFCSTTLEFLIFFYSFLFLWEFACDPFPDLWGVGIDEIWEPEGTSNGWDDLPGGGSGMSFLRFNVALLVSCFEPLWIRRHYQTLACCRTMLGYLTFCDLCLTTQRNGLMLMLRLFQT